MAGFLCVFPVLFVIGSCSGSMESIVKDIVDLFNEALSSQDRLRDINLSFTWRDWVVAEEKARLTCSPGWLEPVQLKSTAEPNVNVREDVRVINLELQANGAQFRYDCELKTMRTLAEALTGSLELLLVRAEMSTVPAGPGQCEVIFKKLSVPSVNPNYSDGLSLPERFKSHNALGELTTPVAENIKRSVEGRLSKFTIRRVILKQECPA